VSHFAGNRNLREWQAPPRRLVVLIVRADGADPLRRDALANAQGLEILGGFAYSAAKRLAAANLAPMPM
jgi:hypothetical protein